MTTQNYGYREYVKNPEISVDLRENQEKWSACKVVNFASGSLIVYMNEKSPITVMCAYVCSFRYVRGKVLLVLAPSL